MLAYMRLSFSRRWNVLAVVVIAAVALIARLTLLIRSSWLLDGDDALSALMALSILDGDRPLMLKSQTYAAAWEPYAMAVSFSLLGVSRAAAKLPELAASLAWVASTWLLAREIAGAQAARFAALFVALPSVYIVVVSLKPLAPYTESAVLGTLALWCVIRIAFRGEPIPRERVLALAAGVFMGLSFWMHPLAVYYLPPLGLTLLGALRGARLVAALLFTSAGFITGALPIWMYNLQTGGATLRFLAGGTRGQSADHLAVLAAWWGQDLARAVGVADAWGERPGIVGVLLAPVLVAGVAWAIFRRPKPPRPRPLDVVLLLLAGIPGIFSLSGFGGPILNPWGFDATGRYMLPFWGGLAVVLGAFLAATWRQHHWAAVALTCVIIGANAYATAVADPVQAFQSTYWAKLPADNGPLLATLRAHNISHVWMNHWAALPAMLDARAAGWVLTAYDWYHVQDGGIDRYPEYLPLVEASSRVAFVLVTDEPEPALEQALEDLGVTYETQRVPPYVVITPTSRKVHPSEVTDALDYRY